MQERLARAFERIWYGHSPVVWLLLPLSLVYRFVFAAHRAWRARGQRSRPGVPVVVIGNLAVGGTGKTPLVVWLARALREHGLSPGIVSRGYRGRVGSEPRRVTVHDDPREVGDEPLLLARNAGCPVAVCTDRRAAVRYLESQDRVDVILTDDGLQHHALARNCEIAVVDGQRGLGNGFCLPAGPLREPVQRLDRVDAVVVNGHGWSCSGAITGELDVTRVERLDGTEAREIRSFRGERVHAFAAIGNPRRFFDLLLRYGLIVIEHAKMDHADISYEELRAAGASTVMMTEKDAVKLGRDAPGNVWCVKVAYVFERSAAERLMAAVLRKLPRSSPA